MLHMYIRTYTRRWCVCVLMYRWGSLRRSRLQYNVKQPLVYPFLYWCLWNFQCIIQLFYTWAYVCRVKGQYTCHKEHHTYRMIPANQKNGWHIVMMSVAMTMTTWSASEMPWREQFQPSPPSIYVAILVLLSLVHTYLCFLSALFSSLVYHLQ